MKITFTIDIPDDTKITDLADYISKQFQDIKIKSDTPAPFITVIRDISGYFAVLMVWNKKGFYDPYQTSNNRYVTKAAAETEAKLWAITRDILYKGDN